MKVGRRVVFFLAIAGICLLLAPVTPTEFRFLNEWMAGVATFWAVAIGIEDVLHARDLRGRDLPDRG